MEINGYQKADKLDRLVSAHQMKMAQNSEGISAQLPVKEEVKAEVQNPEGRIPVLPANFSSEVNFDKNLDMLVVNIMEKDSGEVIKTIPSEEILQMMRRMNEMFENDKSSGMLVDMKI